MMQTTQGDNIMTLKQLQREYPSKRFAAFTALFICNELTITKGIDTPAEAIKVFNSLPSTCYKLVLLDEDGNEALTENK